MRNPFEENFRQFWARFPLKQYRPIHRTPYFDLPTMYLWGLGLQGSMYKASFDQECLKWQSFFLFCGIEFGVKNANEPLMSPSGKLPFLILPTGEVYSIEKLIEFARDNQKNMAELELEEHPETQAFISLADTRLRNALLFYLWCEPENFKQATFPRYGGRYATPLDYILMHQTKKEVIKDLLTRKAVLKREEIYDEANEALQALSDWLGVNEYFLERNSPSFIDAVVFSYVHTILSMPTPERELFDHLCKYKNLVEFDRRICKKFYKEDI